MLLYIFVKISKLIIRGILLSFTLHSRDFYQKEDYGDFSTILFKHNRLSFSMKCVCVCVCVCVCILNNRMGKRSLQEN